MAAKEVEDESNGFKTLKNHLMTWRYQVSLSWKLNFKFFFKISIIDVQTDGLYCCIFRSFNKGNLQNDHLQVLLWKQCLQLFIEWVSATFK